jgi:hypothetical protein
MMKPDVPVVYLDPGLSRTHYLINVDLTTLKGDAVSSRCFKAKVIFYWLKEMGTFLGGRPIFFLLCLVSC